MKPLKILGLAVVAAAALLVFAGVGTASATVLCKNNTGTTNACSETYGSGLALEATLSGTGTLETLEGTILDTCTSGALGGKTTNAGGASETVKANIETLSWSSCSKTTTTVKNGSLEIHWISSTDNGTLTASGTEWTTNTIFGSCVYGFGSNKDLGTITGGNPATISISTTVSKISGSFACPAEARWTASYTFTAPNPLYVSAEASAVPVWDRNTRYLVGATVEWKAGSGKCYRSFVITEGDEPPGLSWESVAC